MQAESIESLIGRSSLGGSGARKLRSRASVSTVKAVRRQAGLDSTNKELRRLKMSKDNNRHVVPNPDGGWDVVAPNSQRASAHAATQGEAERRAKEIVGNLGGGEVVIHRPDGRIRDSDTVAPGNDPYPPKDTRH